MTDESRARNVPDENAVPAPAGLTVGSLYTCESCGGTFETGWTPEEQDAERETMFGNDPGPEGWAIVCDDCFNRMFPQS